MRLFSNLGNIDPFARAGLVLGVILSLLIGAAVPLILAPPAPALDGSGAAAAPPNVPTTVSPRSYVDAVLPSQRSTTRPGAAPTAEMVVALPTTEPVAAIPAVAPTPVTPSAPITSITPVAVASDTPIRAVRTFYQLVDDKEFDAAQELWTQRMRRVFPPAENIVERFAQTQQLTVDDTRLLVLDDAAGHATVRVAVSEKIRAAGTRRYLGTWELVRAGQAWFLDQPDLRLE
ncbi:MAG: hypothetical protein LC797_16810 [Chloroflexi bacterium]|nr:hypothetical protein [Chloroflexota bacterium]